MKQVNKFLNHTEQIEKLSDTAIKDIYNRLRLYEVFFKDHKAKCKLHGKNPFQTEEHQKVVKQLKIEEGEPLHYFIQDQVSIQAQTKISKTSKWEYLTKDDMKESKKIRLAKKKIKNTVNGSCGMPKIEITKHNINKWVNLEENP